MLPEHTEASSLEATTKRFLNSCSDTDMTDNTSFFVQEMLVTAAFNELESAALGFWGLTSFQRRLQGSGLVAVVLIRLQRLSIGFLTRGHPFFEERLSCLQGLLGSEVLEGKRAKLEPTLRNPKQKA